MEQIVLQEFMDKLQSNKKTVILNLKGLVTAIVIVHFAQIKLTQNEIIVVNQHNENEKIILNRHQIMNFEKQRENIMIKFDGLQEIVVSIQD